MGYIWALTYDLHAHRFDPRTETFINFPAVLDKEYSNCAINFIFESSPGVVWMYMAGKGCVRITSQTESSDYTTQLFNSKNGLSSDYINGFWLDSNNGFWIGTYRGVTYLQSDVAGEDDLRESTQFQVDQRMNVNTFCEADSSIWIGTRSGELYKIKNNEVSLIWKTPLVGTKEQSIQDLQVTSNGNLIVATDNGLLMIEKNVDQKHYYTKRNSTLNTNTIRSIYQDRFGDCWLVTDLRGVIRFLPNTSQFTHYPLNPEIRQSILEGEKQVFLEDSNDNLWVGIYGGGISRFNRETNEFDQFTHENNNPGSLSSNLVLSVANDHSGNIWVGTYMRGVNKLSLKQSCFNTIHRKPDERAVFSGEVRSIYEDSRKWIWTGNKQGEIIVYNQDFHQLFNMQEALPNIKINTGVYVFEEDRNNNIWIGTKGAGIIVLKNLPKVGKGFSLEDIQITKITATSESNDDLSNNDVFDLHEDQYGQMWVALYHGGINIIRNPLRNDQQIMHFLKNEADSFAISDNRIRCILEDNEGNIWVGTAKGLNFVDKSFINSDNIKFQLVERTNSSTSLSYNDIINIFKDSNGEIWIGTYGGGINHLKNKTPEGDFVFDKIKEADGLSSNLVLNIVEDQKGYLWIGTDFGLNKYHPQKQIIENFYASDGLEENSFSEGQGVLTSSNKLVFGNLSGMVWFESDSVHKSQRVVPVVLTNLLMNGKTDKSKLNTARRFINKPEEVLQLKYNENFLAFEFAALDFKAPTKIQYEFKLENFEQNWNKSGNLNTAIYRDLNPGNYIFRLRASNSDGAWVNQDLALNIKIKHPPWKTLWAYLAYTILTIIVFMIGRRFFLERIHLKHEVQFEKQLADDKLKFYTSISHEFKTPLSLILGPVDDLLLAKNLSPIAERSLQIVKRNTHRLLELIDQLMDFRKIQRGFFKISPSAGDIVVFMNEIFQLFKPLAERKHINFTFNYKVNEPLILFDANLLEKVVINLISNAFKHTDSGCGIILNLVVIDTEKKLQISVIDEGEGIPEDDLAHIFERFNIENNSRLKDGSSSGIGLSLTKELVEIQGGKILVESKPGKGSRFTVELPFKFAKEELVNDKTGKIDLNYTRRFLKGIGNEEQNIETVGRKSEKKIATVLIVEDNIDLQSYLKNNLVFNYHVLVADNGKIGLELAKNEDPDLIICDIIMPEMDGIELTKMLKTEFHTSHIPIILLTAKSLDEHKFHGLEIGADDYITKPFNMVYLEKRIKNILESRKQLKERFSRDVQTTTEYLANTKKDQEFLDKVIRLVEENLANPEFSIENLLEHFSFGRTVFFKKMKGISGYSPKDFLRIIRMKKAGALLKDPNQSVSQVAYEIGYSDPNYFSRVFRKHFGENPSDYKKRVLAGE